MSKELKINDESPLTYISKQMFDEGNTKSAVILAILESSRERLSESNMEAVNRSAKMSEVILESYEKKSKANIKTYEDEDVACSLITPSRPKSLSSYPVPESEPGEHLLMLPLPLNSIMKKVT